MLGRGGKQLAGLCLHYLLQVFIEAALGQQVEEDFFFPVGGFVFYIAAYQLLVDSFPFHWHCDNDNWARAVGYREKIFFFDQPVTIVKREKMRMVMSGEMPRSFVAAFRRTFMELIMCLFTALPEMPSSLATSS